MMRTPTAGGGLQDSITVDYLEEMATLVAYESAQFNNLNVRLFFLLANLRIKPYLENGVRNGDYYLPHLVELHDDTAGLCMAVAREHKRFPDKVMVIRIYTMDDKRVIWKNPLILDADIRVAIIGDFTQDHSRPCGYLRDTSKFGDDWLSTCKHANLLVSKVGFYAEKGDHWKYFGAMAGSAVIGGAGSGFSSAALGVAGVTALTGVGVVAMGSATAGYYLWGSLFKRWARGGQTATSRGRQLQLSDIMAVDDVPLGDLRYHSHSLMSEEAESESEDDDAFASTPPPKAPLKALPKAKSAPSSPGKQKQRRIRTRSTSARETKAVSN